jgi:F0F1-type ATP synthase assembly protein I
MMNVIKAVWMAKYLLTATIALILIAIYFFAVFSVLILKSDYDKTLSGSCENAWFWSVTIFDSWYKADGTIGGWLGEEAPSLSSNDEYNTDGVRIISDFVFNFIIGILLLEIFSGILTDTFAKIRSEQEELNSIQESRCFVCDKESKEFADFKFHTQYEHNLWDYIIYLFTLMHSKDTKYQELIEKEGKGEYLKEEMIQLYYEGDGKYQFKREVHVEGMEYLEAIIDKKVLLDNSDDYVRAWLAHYELARSGKVKSLEIKRYLSWLSFNLTSMEETRIERKIKSDLEENAKSIREEFEKKEDKLEKKLNEIDEKMDKKMSEMKEMMDEKMNEMMSKILISLEKI